MAASQITATKESHHAEGVKTWVVLIAHAKAAKAAKAAKGAKGRKGRKGIHGG